MLFSVRDIDTLRLVCWGQYVMPDRLLSVISKTELQNLITDIKLISYGAAYQCSRFPVHLLSCDDTGAIQRYRDNRHLCFLFQCRKSTNDFPKISTRFPYEFQKVFVY